MLEAATGQPVDKAKYRGRWVCAPGEERETETGRLMSFITARHRWRPGTDTDLVDATERSEAARGLRRQESLAAWARRPPKWRLK